MIKAHNYRMRVVTAPQPGLPPTALGGITEFRRARYVIVYRLNDGAAPDTTSSSLVRYHRNIVLIWGGLSIVAGVGVLAVVVSAQPPTATDSSLPDGPGKVPLLKACSECHGAEAAVGQLKTRDEWSKTLNEMAGNGAQATAEEWNQILDYLDKHFSLILVNKADAKSLANTLDVSGEQGEAIVRYRETHGRFGTIDDLKRVPALDPATVEARKDRFVF